MFYEIEENKHPNGLNTCPRYNTDICSKLHGKLFEHFIRHARTDRYHIMCSIVAHDWKQLSYEDEESSIGYMPIPKNATTESFEALGASSTQVTLVGDKEIG